MNGVYFNKQRKSWHARATVNGKRVHVGYFKSEESGLQAIESYLENLNVKDTGVLRNHKLELEATNDKQEKFKPRWFTKALSLISRK